MPIRIEVLPEYVHVSWHGKLVEQDVDLLGREMPRIGMELGQAPNVLHTFDKVEGAGLPPDCLRAHAALLAQAKLPNRCRVASVCGSTLAYGMARMMQLLNPNPEIQIEVFTDLKEARRWLTG